MTAAAGIGALVGTLGLASLTTTRYQTLLVMLAAGVLGLALLGLGLAPGFAFALIMMLVIGAGSTGTQALFNTVIQSNVNDAMRGRMTSLYIVTFGVSAFGSLLIGAVADVIGVALAVAGAGALTTLAAILTFLLSPSLRRRSTAES
jgi:predicted MFS family arabinose efflux permease